MTGFKPGDWGADVENLLNASGKRFFKTVTLNWSTPAEILSGEEPEFEESRPTLYAFVRNHHASRQKDKIVYVGLSINPEARFKNHPKAREIIERKGSTKFSFAALDAAKTDRQRRTVIRTMEDVEHILIWTLWGSLENKAKLFTLPGMGTTRGSPLHIVNEGYQFFGQMPREIIYPWMLVKSRKDRSWIEMQS
jgi:hypothetical protein